MQNNISQQSIDKSIIKEFYKNNPIELKDTLKRYKLFYEQQNKLHKIDDENCDMLTMEELLLLFNYRELEYMFSDNGKEKIKKSLEKNNFSLEKKKRILNTLQSKKINENIINLSLENRLQKQNNNKYSNNSIIEKREKYV